ncbi:anti-phage deoxyguanosine triphosphatase [Rhizobium sp. BK251]|uniref:anti-phage deoxyguanosine triphosphatase n=1 Tax=Rhizobium sp. BK251 TaxID=2512125 RepID=UPI00104A325D|nr:anti-phage deoxyguanosine triphosphatase [Rhizobium sp. BK251]TCL74877.1 dGTPase [Rhizobium sp. BK251]
MYVENDYERPVVSTDHQGKDWRKPFLRDYGRIIHSASFRRQQGKTQVFPGHESDFFRNRLTHSLEVAQIAEGIADRLNWENKDRPEQQIDSRLCAIAGLVHDIGHPPFGHNGERALDDQMKKLGGFEGNAQTLRILCRLEKKARYDKPVSGDDRAGLNLCFRTLAAILKYDRPISAVRDKGSKVAKGYYLSEKPIVDEIKRKVLRGKAPPKAGDFKTVECAIMDIADDIAYSVYDLEDCLKAGFLTPAIILASDDKLLDSVVDAVNAQIDDKITKNEIIDTFADIFDGMIPDEGEENPLTVFMAATRASYELSSNAYVRTKLSSALVHEFINGVEFEFNAENPALSKVKLNQEVKRKVEILKQYTFNAVIYSSRVKLGEYRGTEIVTDIFKALNAEKGHLLMPDDVRELYLEAKDYPSKARIICDFVAGMTDRYAVEFWARLRSDGAESIFKSV